MKFVVYITVLFFIASCAKDKAIPAPHFGGVYEVNVQRRSVTQGPPWLPSANFDTSYTKNIIVKENGSPFNVLIEGCPELDPEAFNTTIYSYMLEPVKSTDGKSTWGFGGYERATRGVWFKDGAFTSNYSYTFKTSSKYTIITGKKIN